MPVQAVVTEATFCEHPKNPNFLDLTGRRYGDLVVLGYAGRDHHRRTLWVAVCMCGSPLAVYSGKAMRKGDTISCGCYYRRVVALKPKEGSKYSRKRKQDNVQKRESLIRKYHLEYRAYDSAKSRCNNCKNVRYNRYGGRGIQFKFDSFNQFLDTIGPKPTPQHQIDRIDNDGHYEPGNVRWATRLENMHNRSTTLRVMQDGNSVLLTDIARECEVRYETLRARLLAGWCLECAKTLPASYGNSKSGKPTCLHRTNQLIQG